MVESCSECGSRIVYSEYLDSDVWFVQVNRMCSSLTDQVRSIAVVTTAVARGDLTQKIEISVEGEMSTLKGMFDLLPMEFSS